MFMYRSLFLALQSTVKRIVFPISLVSYFSSLPNSFGVMLCICNKLKSVCYTLSSNMGCSHILSDRIYFYVCKYYHCPIYSSYSKKYIQRSVCVSSILLPHSCSPVRPFPNKPLWIAILINHQLIVFIFPFSQRI